MPDSGSVIDDIKDSVSADDGGDLTRTALVTGSVALGALLTGSLFRKIRHFKLLEPAQLPPAVDAETNAMESMEGSVRFYFRDGSGVPLVLLHSINAAASAHEMAPIFDYFAEHTNRPVYAVDWLGFGRSDRPPVRYTPALFQRHLRRFLSEDVHQPADIVALSMSCEYAAEIAQSLPYLVNRLVFISPTGLSRQITTPAWQRAVVSMASGVGAFEIFYYRLTRREMLRRFYEDHVFGRKSAPEDVVDYAHQSTMVHGAHYAPRYFIQGRLTSGPRILETYAQLKVPSLFVVPTSSEGLIQQFDAAPDLQTRNADHIRVAQVESGLMPQWEADSDLFQVLEDFLISE